MLVLSFVIWKLLPDSPETAKFLTKHEKEYIINRLALETGSGRGRVTNSDKITMKHIWNALKEYKTSSEVEPSREQPCRTWTGTPVIS